MKHALYETLVSSLVRADKLYYLCNAVGVYIFPTGLGVAWGKCHERQALL